MNTAEEPLAGRNATVESSRDVVKFVANFNLLLTVGLQILEDGRVNHVRTVVARHIS